MEVLRTKHPDARLPTVANMDTYPEFPPDLVPVYITNNKVAEVGGRLSRGEGRGGTDSVTLQNWLLHFGAASRELRLIVAYFVEWLSNGRPQWAAYRYMIIGRLIALGKQPGVRLVGVRETWRRMMATCVLRVIGKEAKAACRIEQLAGGVESGIESRMNAMRLL